MDMENTGITMERARKAAETHLEHKGCEILERNGFEDSRGTTIDVIAKDVAADCLVFAVVQCTDLESGFAQEPGEGERRLFEICAAEWLSQRDDLPDSRVRFDAIGICVLGGSKALLRHHVGLFSKVGDNL